MKIKNILTTGLFIMFLLNSIGVAFALPTITSYDDQTFDQNDAPQQLYDITITEDPDSTYITAGEMKITIPDSIEIIFDTDRTNENFLIYGSAVDTGKILESPEITFENGDKTLIIPIAEDFAPGEQITITKAYVKGFNTSSGQSDHLILQINEGEEQYINDKNIYIQTSSLEDTSEPRMPTNLVVEDVDGGVKLTWTDPTDLDLQTIQVMKGLNNYSVDGTPLTEIADGVQEFIDTDVEEGDTVKYILRANDGRNVSENTEQIDFVVGSTEEIIPEEPTPEEEIPEEEVPEEPAEETTPEEPIVTSFTDTADHWALDMITAMAEEGVVNGDPEGTFRPNDNLNRAESSAMLYRVLGIEDPESPTEKPFSDVITSAWYASYINALKDLELVNGNPDGTYKPTTNINRAEFLTLAMNVYYYTADEETKALVDELKEGEMTHDYIDLQDTWYTSNITAATELGFIEGRDCGGIKCIQASADITRAEATKILYSMFHDYLTAEEVVEE